MKAGVQRGVFSLDGRQLKEPQKRDDVHATSA